MKRGGHWASVSSLQANLSLLFPHPSNWKPKSDPAYAVLVKPMETTNRNEFNIHFSTNKKRLDDELESALFYYSLPANKFACSSKNCWRSHSRLSAVLG